MKRRIESSAGTLEYTLTRKKVRNINIRIKPDGEISVSANDHTSVEAVERFIISKQDFIFKALKKYEKLSSRAPSCTDFAPGDTVCLWGRLCLLDIKKGKSGVFASDGAIIISLEEPTDRERKKRLMEAFYKRECEEVLTGLCREVYPSFADKTRGFPKLTFRKMKSCWGICKPGKNTVTFNTRLALLPVELAEYVVYHEFSHFLRPDHSAGFYKILASYLPDYKRREAELKKYVLFDFPG